MVALTHPIRFADAEIFHARLRPDGIRFRYRVLALFIDLDHAAEAPVIRFFSLGRFNLFSFNPADHGPRDGSSLRPYIDQLHAAASLPRPAGITLVCFPRILGHAFNPISTYVCSNERAQTTSLVYEVRNTFGQHHTYLCPVTEAPDGTVLPHECDKLFYVSPFMDMALRYRFLVTPPRSHSFSLKIIERDHDGTLLTALMQASTFEPRPMALLARLVTSPLAGFQVLVGIHRQALRLWLRGHRIRPRPLPPPPVSVAVPGPFTTAKSNQTSMRHA